jgi:hypothetical protein
MILRHPEWLTLLPVLLLAGWSGMMGPALVTAGQGAGSVHAFVLHDCTKLFLMINSSHVAA